jgi:hypothetical protein
MVLDMARNRSPNLQRLKAESFYPMRRSDSMGVEVDQEEILSAVDAESRILLTESGGRLLEEVNRTDVPLPADVARWRKQATAPVVAAAIRIASARARARTKFSRADLMWPDPVGLEQATSETVARYKANRFDCPLIVDLCAGIGGDSLALAYNADVLAVDLEHAMCRRLAWNAAVYQVADRVQPCRARAESFTIPQGAWVHVDPDRRANGRERARSLAAYSPGPDFLRRLIRQTPAGSIKLSPASDFEEFVAGLDVEVELVSLGGECKEATIWFGAAVSCHRRATRLPDNVTWTDRDGDWNYLSKVSVLPALSYVYDPDPALLRSGLLDSFAKAHGLGRIAADVDYLTGDRFVDTRLLAAFRVLSVHPLDLRRLRRVIAGSELGSPLEIKVRGLDLRPEQLRTQLRAHGTHPATLILVGGSGPARAIVAQRVKCDPAQPQP